MSNESERVRALWIALKHEAHRKGFRVDVRSIEDGVSAYSIYSSKEIVIAGGLDSVEAVARLAHEVGHAHLHAELGETSPLSERGVHEIEAELFAYAMLQHNGIRPGDSMIRYMTHWARRVAPQAPAALFDEISARLVPATLKISADVQNYMRDQMRPAQSHPAEQPFVAPDYEGPVL